ncbi:MAG: alpha/beta fold hydrolase [Acidobacteria bacterium]|nr:alpha/beta fold hydrolase [Acidobacteriota bacterium]
MAESRRIELDRGAAITALRYAPPGPATAALVLAHGAGAGQSSDFMTGFAAALAARSLEVVTFNFPFTERGKKLPDPQPVLESCYRAVLAHVAADRGLGAVPLFIGGKSLGGRIASHLAASRDADESATPAWWDQLHGLVFLGYPLHPPGKPQQVRVAHLPQIAHPILIVQGAKDAFGTPPELRLFFDVLPARTDLYVVEHGNHALEVPKRSGLVQAEVFGQVQDRIVAWITKTVASATHADQLPRL